MSPARAKIAWEGSAGLRKLLVPVDECIPHPDNPRRGDLDLIEESLRTYGQVRPILRAKDSKLIVAGNHTYRAATERLGWNRVAVVDAELTDEEARRYLLMDNRSSDAGSYDQEALATILTELAEVGKLAGTGYSAENVDSLLVEVERVRQGVQYDGPEPPQERPPLSATRQVVIMLDPERHEQFGRFLRMLAKELDTDGPSETIYRTVEAAARAL